MMLKNKKLLYNVCSQIGQKLEWKQEQKELQMFQIKKKKKILKFSGLS